jgi:hypothetical protein
MIKIWLTLFFRGLLLWIVLNWTVFLLVDSFLTSLYFIYQKFVYKFLVLSVISYLLSLYPLFFKKLFQIKDLLDLFQIKYFLRKQTLLWSIVFFSFVFLISNNISEDMLVTLHLFVPVPLYLLSCFLISFKLTKLKTDTMDT